MCMNDLPAYMYVCVHVHAQGLWRPEERIRSSGTAVSDSDKPVWVLKIVLGRAEQPMLIAEQSLQIINKIY